MKRKQWEGIDGFLKGTGQEINSIPFHCVFLSPLPTTCLNIYTLELSVLVMDLSKERQSRKNVTVCVGEWRGLIQI